LRSDPGLPQEHVDQLEGHRARLWALAYRLTGSGAEADDIVHDTFERALTRPPRDLDRPLEPWLVRVATNLGLDALRRRRHIQYAGDWLPMPVDLARRVGAGSPPPPDAASRYEWLESLSYAFLLALEALEPTPRAVLVLRDVLGYSGQETADLLELSEGNVRVILHRARRALEGYDRARLPASGDLEARTRETLERFMRGLLTRDVAGLEALLAEDVRTLTDGDNRYTALHGPLEGRPRVMRLYLEVTRRRGADVRITACRVNGQPALLVEFAQTERRQAPCALIRCELDAAGRIREIHTVLGRGKLGALLEGL
jgi:RNA polymerase sigma-70 factor (ECF subfamily)